MKQGWQIKKLGCLCSFERGLTYSKGDEVAISTKGVLRSNNVDLSSNTLIFDEIKYLKDDIDIPVSKKVKRNSILMCMSNGSKAHLGKVAIIEDDLDYAFGGFMGLLVPDEDAVFPRYFYYALITPIYKSFIKSLSDGANINNLKFADLKEFEIPVPSISEQQRIVALLDAEFAKIDAMKANAEKNLQNAKDLFQAALKKELEPKEGWKVHPLKDVSQEMFAGGDAPKDSMSKDITPKYQIPIYANAVEKDGLYGFTDTARVRKPSITIAGRGSGTGHVIERSEAYFPIVRLIVILPKEQIIGNRYLYYAIRSLNIKPNGSAIPQLTIPMIANYPIPYPDIEKQSKIVARLDALNDKCKSLQANYEKTLSLCDDLKQALLRKAFNGEI